MTKKIDSFQLKLLAITGMLINHMGIVFEWSRSMPTLPLFAISEFVGKFTFPIMAYLLVEGYHYTRDVKKYALRLAGFWVLSIYPFYLLHRPDYAFSLTDVPNNIFFTLPSADRLRQGEASRGACPFGSSVRRSHPVLRLEPLRRPSDLGILHLPHKKRHRRHDARLFPVFWNTRLDRTVYHHHSRPLSNRAV